MEESSLHDQDLAAPVETAFGKPWKILKDYLRPNPHLNSYALITKLMYDVACITLVCPLRLIYDKNRNILVVQKCTVLQQSGCIFVQILSTISAIKTTVETWRQLMKDTGYIISYFDFMTGFFLNAYLYTLLYLHWFQVPRIQAFVESLQMGPLPPFSTMRPWKMKCLVSFFWILALYLSYIWLLIVYGFDHTQWRQSSADIARQIFWLEDTIEEVPTFLCILALIGRFYNALFIMVPPNVFGPLNLFTMSFVAHDFFCVALKKELPITEILYLYREYKKVLGACNELVGSWCIHFVSVTMSYHSLHLFDALNVQDPIWKLSTYIYLLYLVNFLVLPAKTLMLAHKMKAWLWTNQNCMNMDTRELCHILYDLSYWTNGLAIKGGKFFKLSTGFSGMVIQQLLSYSMLNIMAQRFS